MSSVPAFSGLTTALRGVISQQRALDVTGHNIANVETKGYSRQEAVLGATNPLLLDAGQIVGGYGAQLGQGVDVLEFRRLRDDFLDLQWRGQNGAFGEADTLASRLRQVESSVNDTTSSGISAQLNAFYNGWGDLAAHPESAAARTVLYGNAQNLIGGLRGLDAALTTLSGQATSAIADTLAAGGPIDKIAQELRQLNDGINQAQIAGIQPNDLLDRRDLLLDQLSQYGSVSTSVPDTTRPGHMRVIFAGQSAPLVDNDAPVPITLPTPASIAPPATPPGGRLSGLLQTGAAIADYRTQLDTLAARLVSQVNGQHGAPPFFDPAGTTAATIALGAAITGPQAILAGASGAPGDNSIALAISQQRSSTGANPTTDWATLLARVGSDVNIQQVNTQTSQRVLDSITAQRTSQSGVSLDEEMANMLRFQRGYQASARALTTMDENLDILINRTGRVGL